MHSYTWYIMATENTPITPLESSRSLVANINDMDTGSLYSITKCSVCTSLYECRDLLPVDVACPFATLLQVQGHSNLLRLSHKLFP
jgi:hypothetical protein